MKRHEERIEFRKFAELNDEQKRIVAKSWGNPFNQRYNYEPGDIYQTVDELSKLSEPSFKPELINSELGDVYYQTMYFRVVFLKGTEEIVGTCRYGKYYGTDEIDYWDFGFNVLLKYWFKGFGTEIVKKIIEIAKNHEIGVKKIRGGADLENYGSYKAMVRNGFDFVGCDKDGDYEYILDLSKPQKTEKEIEENWSAHMEMTKKDLDKKKQGLFENLEYINSEIKIMVTRIQSGEDEDLLVQEYFEKLNQIEEFKFE